MPYQRGRGLGRGSAVAAGVAVFAAVSLACEGTNAPPVTAFASDTADQVIFGLTHVLTEDGVLRARLEADSGYHYEATQTWELFEIEVTFYSAVGEETSTLTADEGTYEWRTGNMQARGHVVGVTPDGRRLTTSVLNYEKVANQLVGPAAFVFDAPDQHLEGSSFTADPDFRDVRATNVRGTPGQVDVNR
jgi:LPS export ABC transporter protein LptC